MTWNPEQYLKFGSERLRPAIDLLHRVPLEAPRTIADLGCGTGTVTALLRERWRDARIEGIDNSATMLERAQSSVPGVEWTAADLGRWSPSAPVDLLVSNAALHWLDDHDTLFPRLVAHLAPGGMLAVQMPAQHDAPSHQLGYALAENPRWKEALKGTVRRRPVLEPAQYHALLSLRVAALEIWTTEYLQALSGPNPVAEFTKGSFVGAWLAALPAEEAAAFEAEYRAAIAQAYRPRADGVTLFPFRRLFIVARR